MTQAPPFRKIFDGVATRKQMFELFNRVPDAPDEDIASGRAYSNRWFQIYRSEYDMMFERMPPRLMRADMFALSELKAGTVGSVFFDIMIDGCNRWFHGWCDLGDPRSLDAMRAAIIAHEKAVFADMTREQKLEMIWTRTHPDFRGLAGDADPDAWLPEDRGKRTIVICEPGGGSVLKLLERLTDDEINYRLPSGPTI